MKLFRLVSLKVNNAVKVEQSVRHNWADWRMMKDVKRRNLLVKHGAERLRLKALKKNDLLPQEITVTLQILKQLGI